MSSLILVNCSSKKEENCTSNNFVPPLYDIENLRKNLLGLVSQNPLRGNCLTKAKDLYKGRFFEKLNGFSNTNHDIHILIISSLYGIVQLDEGIYNYNLTVNSKLEDNRKVKKFWIENNLSKYINKYIEENSISIMWSLISIDYLKFFERDNFKINSFKVKIENEQIGSVSPTLKGKWLNKIINEKIDLEYPQKIPTQFDDILIESRNEKCVFNYERF